jgi:mannosyltransferase OCH1-like enzyme
METKDNEYIDNYFKNKLKNDASYTYKQALIDIKKELIASFDKKLLEFNKDIEYNYDANGMPKLIHFTCKDKSNINNDIWKECLNKYYSLYPDYKITIYDDNDIYKIIEFFNKKKLPDIKKIKLGAVLADVFRYLILYLRGGYYSDMDCLPFKRIEDLAKTQFHGDAKNDIHIYPINVALPNNKWDFHYNPCNNCKTTYIEKNTFNQMSKKICNCLGHKYITETTSIIVGYEFEKTWHNELIKNDTNHMWTDKNVGICQWFIGAKPQEKIFLKCYKNSLKNAVKLNVNDKANFHYNVINSTGPLFFTKIINNFLVNDSNFKYKISCLPCDYFCCGSGEKVPSTKNKFIQHKFTGTWLK